MNSVRTLLTREKEDNSLVVEKMKKQLTQKDTQVQELMKERQADKEVSTHSLNETYQPLCKKEGVGASRYNIGN